MSPDEIFARYRPAGVLVDSNLLLLYFVGSYDRNVISRFKRTAKFTPEDYTLLHRFLSAFTRIVTTPHILTEISNLAGQLYDRARLDVMERLAAGIHLLHEVHTPSIELARTPSFKRFGLTDSGVVSNARGKFLVLTDDFRLSQFLHSEGVHVFNFNHLRMYGSFASLQ
jgi:hypothetical protein